MRKRKLIAVLMILLLLTTILSVDTNISAKTLKMSKKKIVLNVGDKSMLSVMGTTSKKVKWKSSKSKVASVTSKGKVTANKKGKALITATFSGKKLMCTVIVKESDIDENLSIISTTEQPTITPKPTMICILPTPPPFVAKTPLPSVLPTVTPICIKPTQPPKPSNLPTSTPGEPSDIDPKYEMLKSLKQYILEKGNYESGSRYIVNVEGVNETDEYRIFYGTYNNSSTSFFEFLYTAGNGDYTYRAVVKFDEANGIIKNVDPEMYVKCYRNLDKDYPTCAANLNIVTYSKDNKPVFFDMDGYISNESFQVTVNEELEYALFKWDVLIKCTIGGGLEGFGFNYVPQPANLPIQTPTICPTPPVSPIQTPTICQTPPPTVIPSSTPTPPPTTTPDFNSILSSYNTVADYISQNGETDSGGNKYIQKTSVYEMITYKDCPTSLYNCTSTIKLNQNSIQYSVSSTYYYVLNGTVKILKDGYNFSMEIPFKKTEDGKINSIAQTGTVNCKYYTGIDDINSTGSSSLYTSSVNTELFTLNNGLFFQSVSSNMLGDNLQSTANKGFEWALYKWNDLVKTNTGLKLFDLGFVLYSPRY